MQIDEEWAPYGVTWYDTYQWEQEAQQREAPETPAWKLEALPVNDPEGEPLGYAMQMVVEESVEPWPSDPDAAPPLRMLEIAHFETTEAADKFAAAFNAYVKPGLLEGPELAEEVARLEGDPAEWKTLEGQQLEDYHEGRLTLTRDPADWQPYNPNAERDARIEAEGLDLEL